MTMTMTMGAQDTFVSQAPDMILFYYVIIILTIFTSTAMTMAPLRQLPRK